MRKNPYGKILRGKPKEQQLNTVPKSYSNWKYPFVCFQFSSQIEFWEQFLFSVHFGLPKKFFSLKNRKLFLKTENKGKKSVTKHTLKFLFLLFIYFYYKFLISWCDEWLWGSKKVILVPKKSDMWVVG